ncbi:hypothetical protein ACFSQD_04445 [Flavihumibacter stibioxidans]|uniref:Uncharacterized protein n=1 Tax=Flavihumibacter stibioxidans TaxID=1834163 RepID=A0ABR7M3G8_9BACT|nr:hypothetical protein [Flavihumibacter stibioxidans]MBC6489558.1 hypothetical protein [Flavihumibacter stibioxidans]
MPVETLKEKTLPLSNGVGWPYLEEDLGRISIYPVLTGSNNAFTFFLGHYEADGGQTTGSEPERSTLQIRLSLELPGTDKPGPVIRTHTLIQILLQEGSSSTLVLEKSFAGTDTSLQAVLDARYSKALLLAVRQKASGLTLRIQSEVYLSSSQHQYTIRSQMSMEELLRVCENHQVIYKYFDPASNNYRLIPEQVNGSDATRNISQTLSGKIEKGRIVNAAFAQVPAASLPMLSVKKQELMPYDARIRLHRLENWSIAVSEQEKIKDYPIITDASSQFWPNRRNQQELLVLPEPRPVIPNLQTPANQSPFRFTFQNTGMTDINGKPVLEGSLALTLDYSLTGTLQSAASAAHPGKSIRSIRFDQVNYLLEIPYVNEEQESVWLQIAASETSVTGEQTQLVFRLLNNAIRLCYAAISGNQPTLKLQVMLVFSGYSRVEPQLLQLHNIVGSKISQIQPGRGFRPVMASRIDSGMHAIAQPAVLLQPVVLAQLIEPTVQYKVQSYVRTLSIAVEFPCTMFGQYYLEESEGIETAIGCKEAYKLGETPLAWYTRLPELDTPSFKVYRSTNVPNDFLVIPSQYVIGRQLAEDKGKEIYRPTILLFSTLDAVGGNSKWVLDATLVPDISLDKRYELEKACASLTPYPPNIQYLTELPAGSSEAVLSMDHMTGTVTRVYPYGKYIRMNIETDISSILILLDMLERDAINGLLTITLPGEEKYSTRLQPSLQQIGGEWTNGHCRISYDGAGKLEILNQTESRLQFSGITALVAPDTEETIGLVAELEGFGRLEQDIPARQYQRFIPHYTLVDPAPVELEQINNYIEDVQCQVIFLSTLDFNGEGLAVAEISYRLKGATQESLVQLTQQQRSQEVFIQMPVTHFLMERVIEYRITKLIKVDRSETVMDTGFSEQDLSNKGNIIYINL